MLKIVFRNMERSELAREIVESRFRALFLRFTDLAPDDLCVTLQMENSPFKAGRDVFAVKVRCHSGSYQGLQMEKKDQNLYRALAELIDHLQEKLNRFGDRHRVFSRNRARQILSAP